MKQVNTSWNLATNTLKKQGNGLLKIDGFKHALLKNEKLAPTLKNLILNKIMKNKVETIANHLIKENGQTTTLEVKTELRNRGEWVDQSEVSKFMNELTREGEFEYTFNGQFRVYTVPQVNTQLSNFLTNNTAAATNNPIQDWVVYNSQDVDSSVVIKNTTRGKARYAGAPLLNINYNQTRAKKHESN